MTNLSLGSLHHTMTLNKIAANVPLTVSSRRSNTRNNSNDRNACPVTSISFSTCSPTKCPHQVSELPSVHSRAHLVLILILVSYSYIGIDLFCWNGTQLAT